MGGTHSQPMRRKGSSARMENKTCWPFSHSYSRRTDSCRHRQMSELMLSSVVMDDENAAKCALSSKKCDTSKNLHMKRSTHSNLTLASTRSISSLLSPLSRMSDESTSSSVSACHNTESEVIRILRCFPLPNSRASFVRSSSLRLRPLKRTMSFDVVAVDQPVQRRIKRSKSTSGSRKLRVLAKFKKKSLPDDVNSDRKPLEKLAMVSIDTMAITALPLNYWLQERLKTWVQLSGHEGSIVPASDQTLWKRKASSDVTEANAYRKIMNDAFLKDFIPRFYKEVKYKNESFIEIEDLTSNFVSPTIMDIKMGVRTFSEVEAQDTKLRSDLYEKLVTLDPDELTAEENEAKAITKVRYMRYRESQSSTISHGFRIEAAKMPGGSLQRNFKNVKSHSEISKTLWTFLGGDLSICERFVQRLSDLRAAAQKSTFFRTHEIIGSSLLLMYDSKLIGAWMIDFAKSVPVEGISITHIDEWRIANHEDGYLIGLNNLISIIDELKYSRSSNTVQT